MDKGKKLWVKNKCSKPGCARTAGGWVPPRKRESSSESDEDGYYELIEKLHKHYQGKIERMEKRMKAMDEGYIDLFQSMAKKQEEDANEIEKLHKQYQGLIGSMEKRMKSMEQADRAMVKSMDLTIEKGDQEGDDEDGAGGSSEINLIVHV